MIKRLEKIGVIQPLRDRNGWRRLTQEDLQKARIYFYRLEGQENHPTSQGSSITELLGDQGGAALALRGCEDKGLQRKRG